MTDAEIIKALECCAKLTHNGWGDNMKICQEQCPYKANCYDEEKNINMIADAVDLINRQQAEVEELKSAMNCYRPYEEEQRAEAIKEFAERVKNECAFECDVSLGYGRPCYEDAIPIIAIDNLVKEIIGDTE